MQQNDSLLCVSNTHAEADAAIKSLSGSGFDMTKQEHPVGFYTALDKMRAWGGVGAFWGGIWGLLLAPAVSSSMKRHWRRKKSTPNQMAV